jgi:hypothetical protein
MDRRRRERDRERTPEQIVADAARAGELPPGTVKALAMLDDPRYPDRIARAVAFMWTQEASEALLAEFEALKIGGSSKTWVALFSRLEETKSETMRLHHAKKLLEYVGAVYRTEYGPMLAEGLTPKLMRKLLHAEAYRQAVSYGRPT